MPLKISQRTKMRNLFESRPYQNIPITDMMRLGIARYGPRIDELRSQGMDIKNSISIHKGIKHSTYQYIPSPTG